MLGFESFKSGFGFGIRIRIKSNPSKNLQTTEIATIMHILPYNIMQNRLVVLHAVFETESRPKRNFPAVT